MELIKINNEEKILKILGELSDKFDKMQETQDSMQSDIGSLKSDVSSLKVQVNESTQVLKSLEHKTDEHKALLDQLNYRTATVANSKDLAKYNFL